MRFKSISAAALLAIAAGSAVLPAAPVNARPLTPAEQRFARWKAVLPQCNDPSVIDRILTRFGERETYYWQSGLDIKELQNVRETGFRSNGLDYIPRRYCSARAAMTDSKLRDVYYSVGEDLGMTGTDVVGSLIQSLTFGTITSSTATSSILGNFGVDWCVVGLDRNYAYGLNCRAARP